MGEVKQSREEKERLLAIWEARPEVIAFTEHAEAFAWKNNLKFDSDGLNRMLRDFGSSWVAEHGPLPPTGIVD